MRARRDQSLVLQQTVINARHPPIHVQCVDERKLAEQHLSAIIASDRVGAAPAYNRRGALSAVAFATAQHAIVVHIANLNFNGRQQSPGRDVTQSLLSSDVTLYAFNGHALALAIYQGMQLQPSAIVDIQSIQTGKHSRDAIKLLKHFLEPEIEVYDDNISPVFKNIKIDEINNDMNSLIQQAWLAHFFSTVDEVYDQLMKVPRIDLRNWSDKVCMLKPVYSCNGYLMEYNSNSLIDMHRQCNIIVVKKIAIYSNMISLTTRFTKKLLLSQVQDTSHGSGLIK